MKQSLTLLVLTLTAVFVPSAQSARVYFTDQPAGAAGSVISVAPDGTGQQTLITVSNMPDLRGIAYHRASGRIFFLDRTFPRQRRTASLGTSRSISAVPVMRNGEPASFPSARQTPGRWTILMATAQTTWSNTGWERIRESPQAPHASPPKERGLPTRGAAARTLCSRSRCPRTSISTSGTSTETPVDWHGRSRIPSCRQTWILKPLLSLPARRSQACRMRSFGWERHLSPQ